MAADEDTDVFEITDFTTASEWERFIAKFEEVLHEWKLVNRRPLPAPVKDEYTKGTWDEVSEEVTFADFKFVVTHHFLKRGDESESQGGDIGEKVGEEADEQSEKPVLPDMMCMENDFPSKAHCLCRWYGLREFITVCPSTDTLDTESRIKLLLSSVSIALNNTNCTMPVFIQILQKTRRVYTGVCINSAISTDFDMVHLKRPPSQYNHLAGLLNAFKSKLAVTSINHPPVSVSVRFTYILPDWPNAPWPQILPDINTIVDNRTIVRQDWGCLPFGACEDPVSELHLSCTWPCLSEEIIVENQAYSDLDPLQAPQWSVRVSMRDNPQCLLSEYLGSFLQLCSRTETTHQLLGSMEDDDSDVTQALQRLTEPGLSYSIPTIQSVVSNAQSRLKVNLPQAPLPDDLLNTILEFLFPDAVNYPNRGPEADIDETNPKDDTTPTKEPSPYCIEFLKEAERQLKSSPVSSLTTKLSVCSCIVNHEYGGLSSVTHLWQEFVMEVRYRWTNGVIIPGLEEGSPNLGSCILHQKLQMLNCCIERKRKREQDQSRRHFIGSDDPDVTTLDNTNTDDTTQPVHMDSNVQTDDITPNEYTETDEVIETYKANNNTADNDADDDDDDDDDEFFECDSQSDYGNDDDITDTNQHHSNETSENTPQQLTRTDAGENLENLPAVSSINTNSNVDLTICYTATTSLTIDDKTSSNKSKPTHMSDTDHVNGSNAKLSQPSKMSLNKSEISRDDSFHSVTEQPRVLLKAVGRLCKFGDLKLFHSGEPMYVPMTQEPSPMTEDMLEEHAEVLARLGTTIEGARLRARMQSACLLSDMESFKAANPGCSLEDFVRWYSPRDWVEESANGSEDRGVTGSLSQRMQIAGNMWMEVWAAAKPVSARRQKRLFDDTKEAEKVLHMLSSLPPFQVVLHLLPSLFHASLASITEHDVEEIPTMKQHMSQIMRKLSKTTRAPEQDTRRYKELLKLISLAETVVARAKSLRSKFTDDLLDIRGGEEELRHFVWSLLQNSEVSVRGGPLGPGGTAVHKMFVASQKVHAFY